MADMAHDTQGILEKAKSQDMNVVIPPKKSRKEQREYDKRLYKIRHLVEKCVSTSSTLAWYYDTLCKKIPVYLLPLSRLGV